MAHRTLSSHCHGRRGVRSWTGHHEWFGHHPRGTCQTPGRKFGNGRSHGGSDAEFRKCAVHHWHCILDSSERDKIPGICDPQVGNSGSVNHETLRVGAAAAGVGYDFSSTRYGFFFTRYGFCFSLRLCAGALTRGPGGLTPARDTHSCI